MTTDEERRARLQAAIAEKDAARGRPLTDRERLDNLAAALDEMTADEIQGAAYGHKERMPYIIERAMK